MDETDLFTNPAFSSVPGNIFHNNFETKEEIISQSHPQVEHHWATKDTVGVAILIFLALVLCSRFRLTP